MPRGALRCIENMVKARDDERHGNTVKGAEIARGSASCPPGNHKQRDSHVATRVDCATDTERHDAVFECKSTNTVVTVSEKARPVQPSDLTCERPTETYWRALAERLERELNEQRLRNFQSCCALARVIEERDLLDVRLGQLIHTLTETIATGLDEDSGVFEQSSTGSLPEEHH